MADSPTPPVTVDTAQSLQQIEAQLNVLREHGDAGRTHTFNRLGGTDAMRALYARQRELLDGTSAGAAPVEEESGPRLSSDPAEAAMGLTKPAPRDPEAVAARLEYLGVDPKAWKQDDRAFLRGISSAIPPALVSDAVNLIRDAGGMAEDAADRRYSETHCDELTADRWGHEYDEKWDYVEAALGQLQARDVTYLRSRHLLTYPPFLDKLATLGERFLQTDDGIRWRLTQSAKALAEQDKAERETARRAATDEE